MAFFEDLAEGEILSGNVLGGLAIGAAALIVMPLAAPLLRPIAKTAIKGGILAFNGTKTLYDQAASGVTEFAAEVQREVNAIAATMASAPLADALEPNKPAKRNEARVTRTIAPSAESLSPPVLTPAARAVAGREAAIACHAALPDRCDSCMKPRIDAV